MELYINIIHSDNTRTDEWRYRKFPQNHTPTAHQLGKNILDALEDAKREFPDEELGVVLDITLTP